MESRRSLIEDQHQDIALLILFERASSDMNSQDPEAIIGSVYLTLQVDGSETLLTRKQTSLAITKEMITSGPIGSVIMILSIRPPAYGSCYAWVTTGSMYRLPDP